MGSGPSPASDRQPGWSWPPRPATIDPRMPTRTTNSPPFRVLRALGDLAIGLFALYLAFVIRIRLPIPMTAGRMPTESLATFILQSSLLIALTQNLALYFFGLYDDAAPFLASSCFVDSSPRPLCRGFCSWPSISCRLSASRVDPGRFRAHPSRPTLRLPLPAPECAEDRAATRGDHRHLSRSLRASAKHRTPPLAGADDCRPLALAGGSPIRLRWHLNGRDRARTIARYRRGSASSFEQEVIDVVILVAGEDDWRTALVDRLARRPTSRRTVLLLPSPFDSLIGRARFRAVHDAALIDVVRESEWHLNRPLKRLFDLLSATLLLILSAPVMVICAFLIRLTSRGPVLYSQRRVGQNLETFPADQVPHHDRRRRAGNRRDQSDPGRSEGHPLRALSQKLSARRAPAALQRSGGLDEHGRSPARETPFVDQYIEEVPGYLELLDRPASPASPRSTATTTRVPRTNCATTSPTWQTSSSGLDISILFRTVRIVLSTRGT